MCQETKTKQSQNNSIFWAQIKSIHSILETLNIVADKFYELFQMAEQTFADINAANLEYHLRKRLNRSIEQDKLKEQRKQRLKKHSGGLKNEKPKKADLHFE